MGLDTDSIRGITVAALSLEEGTQETLCQTALGAAEKFLSRQYLCRGFCSGGRIVLLLTSDTGFLKLQERFFCCRNRFFLRAAIITTGRAGGLH